MDIVTITGVAASVCTAVSLIPQLVKVIKKKKAGDISLVMMLILFTGLGLWTIYGIMKNDLIIIISNAFSFMINLALGILSIKYKNK